MNGAQMIAGERQRQIDAEGWTPEHDDEHTKSELCYAAARYAIPDEFVRSVIWWPWAARFWKPSPDDRIRELVKAGALIAAEIDRLTRRGAR